MKSISIALVACLALTPLTASAAKAPKMPPYVQAAVADPARGKDSEVDARRKIAELMTFSGVKPGDRVLELVPGSGYFTRVFSRIVGPKGHVYAVWPTEYDKVSQPDSNNLSELSKQPAWSNIAVLIQPAATLTAPQLVDVVFTSQNYHDYPNKFMGNVNPSVLNTAVFKALKPGGVWVIVDHVAAVGSGMRDTDTLHRIDPEIVKKQATAAGFVFVGESDVLRNPADPHDIKVFDQSIRGHTDQFAFKFRKPTTAR